MRCQSALCKTGQMATVRAWTRIGPLAAAALIVTSCGIGLAEPEPSSPGTTPTSDSSAGACPSDPVSKTSAPDPLISGFTEYETVNLADFHTYEDYGWNGAQFETCGGVRCRLYDGPNSWQYYAMVYCWGRLPGLPEEQNYAKVDGTASFGYRDPAELEVSGMPRKPIDPADYHLLAPGQKIVMPGARSGSADPTSNAAVCAAGPDGEVTCEIQNGEFVDGATHGFVLSPDGSRTY